MRTVSRSLHYRLSRLDGVFAFAMALAATVYGNSSRVPLEQMRRFLEARITPIHAVFALFFMFLWSYCFETLGLYRPECRGTIRNVVRLVSASFAMSWALICYLQASHTTGPSYRIGANFFLCSVTYELCRIALRRWLIRRNPQLVLILGSGRRAVKAYREIRTRYHGTVELVGFVDDRSVSEMAPDIAARWLGNIDQLSEILFRNVVDELLIAVPMRSCYQMAQRAIEIAEQIGVRTVYMQDVYVSKIGPHSYSEPDLFNDLVPFHQDYIARQEIKRFLDIAGSLIGLLLLSPLFLLIAIAIKTTSKGPVFFVQKRYGYRRRLFDMFKFRSMVSNASDLMAVLETENEARGPIFKIRLDPRVTPLGRFLRATSLDELPQLWNVLIGNMSLVGPRPMSVRDVSLFSEATLMRRFTVKPGVTGLWQVSERNALNFEKWIELDFSYIDRWSLMLDLAILARTVPAVFKRTGAV